MIKKGCEVLIKKCYYTNKSFGLAPAMEKMIGKTYKVTEVISYYRENKSNLCVTINGWDWSDLDLEIIVPKRPKIKPETFDIRNLTK